MNLKSDLKNIISKNLSELASSIFMDKSLSIIDESAESKESLLVAADKVSKRIALFIDADLSKKVFDILKQEIDNREFTHGIRRKHVRVAVNKKIYVTFNGTASELNTVNISAGGMYIETKIPFPVGSKAVISLPLKTGSHLRLKGVVANVGSAIGKLPPGMGIEFKEVRDDERKILIDFLKSLSVHDIVENKDETEVKPLLVNNRELSF